MIIVSLTIKKPSSTNTATYIVLDRWWYPGKDEYLICFLCDYRKITVEDLDTVYEYENNLLRESAGQLNNPQYIGKLKKRNLEISKILDKNLTHLLKKA